jgi:Tfp pilus assembly protein PilW
VNRSDTGFSLLEAILATAITLAILASLFAMLNPAYGMLAMEPESADMQQRLRVAVDALTRDLAVAGSGADLGAHPGPLLQAFAPVLPFRQSVLGDDPPGVVRSDMVTLISVPATAAQTTLAADLQPGALTIQAAPGPGCATGANLCGFSPGMTIVIYDDTGNFDTFAIAAVADAAAQITLTARPAHSAATTYPAGARVVQARIDIYYLKADAATQTFQLMRADGSANADAPAVDHVVGLTFEYDGEPRPPAIDASGTTYGPLPPAAETQTTAYPPGENCVFRIDEDSGQPVSRLAALSAGAALTRLSMAQFADGPWCPDDSNGNRWDADLLRVRRVGVTVRVETALAALRGPAGVLFANAGTARAAERWSPDREIHFQIAPRSLNLWRR